MAQLSAASANLAANLLKELHSDSNLFFSPASISVALSMAHQGAAGKTREQMSGALFAGLEDVAGEHGKLLETLNASEKQYEMRSANKLYAQQGMNIEDPFMSSMNKNYSSAFELVNFVTEAEKIRTTINSWVEKQTNEKIKDLIAPGVLDPLTRLVIVNAIYFKGKWKTQFKERETIDFPFHIAEGKQTQVKMMQNTKEFGYSENNSYQMLRMPYVGDEISMLVLLPKERFGLKKMVSELTGEAIIEAIKKTSNSTKVEVKFPRFKLEQSFELKPVLTKLGCGEMFSQAADFTGITKDKPGLYVSAVIHKAFVEVNEEGTEAAAATAIVADTFCMMEPEEPDPQFTADHPFMFFLVHESHAVLFGGAVHDF